MSNQTGADGAPTPEQFAEIKTLATDYLATLRNRITSEIDRRTAETENTPGAMTIVRDFVNWYGWYEREGFDDESREELERIVGDARRLLSSPNGAIK